jgi:hypothetical protein
MSAWTSVKYRVCAISNYNMSGAYVTTNSITIIKANNTTVNINGVNYSNTEVYTNVGGVWKKGQVYINVGGVWKT